MNCKKITNIPNMENWNVSDIRSMAYMFSGALNFNQNIEYWDTSNVRTMKGMFNGASSFNQDISNWDISRIKYMSCMLYKVKLSSKNYDALLKGRANLPSLPSNIYFSDGNSKYTAGAEKARQKLISDYKWKISDGGLTNP